jgi:Tfp pilus assembly protein PilX
MNTDQFRLTAPGRESGSALLVAILLLLLAAVMTFAALNVGIFEQRSTGNDIRAKAVNDVAEAGLAQGFEYLMRQHTDMLQPDPGTWQKCGAAEVVFPCGAVSADLIDTNGDGTPDTARRATLYKLKQTTHTITGLASELSNYMLALPSSSKISAAGDGGTVAYGVAPLMCFVKRPDAAAPSTTPLQCGTGSGATATTLRIVTFVSVAKIPGESASATLIQTLGEYPKLNNPIGKPPITASGAIDITGGLQVVTNPNSGGPGVPVSVWTRLNVSKTGTTNTCYADEFFRYTQGSVTPEPYQGTIRCDDCKCDTNGAPNSISYDSSGNVQQEGMDILDVEGTSADRGAGANWNVKSDSLSYPTCEFPKDLFQFVFGVKVWSDSNNDCFGETKLPNVVYTNPDNSAASASVGPDEAWLYANADKIIPLTANEALLRTGQSATGALFNSPVPDSNADAKGLIWCQTSCNIGSGKQVGTAENPVILVVDSPVSIQGVVFGMVFVRSTGSALSPATGGSGTGACPSNCALTMNAGAAIYGALVLQGQMKANGTSAVIHDATVLRRLNEQQGMTPASLPGAWTDRVSF